MPTTKRERERAERNRRQLEHSNVRFLTASRQRDDALREWCESLEVPPLSVKPPFASAEVRELGRAHVASLRELASAFAARADKIERLIIEAHVTERGSA